MSVILHDVRQPVRGAQGAAAQLILINFEFGFDRLNFTADTWNFDMC